MKLPKASSTTESNFGPPKVWSFATNQPYSSGSTFSSLSSTYKVWDATTDSYIDGPSAYPISASTLNLPTQSVRQRSPIFRPHPTVEKPPSDESTSTRSEELSSSSKGKSSLLRSVFEQLK